MFEPKLKSDLIEYLNGYGLTLNIKPIGPAISLDSFTFTIKLLKELSSSTGGYAFSDGTSIPDMLGVKAEAVAGAIEDREKMNIRNEDISDPKRFEELTIRARKEILEFRAALLNLN